MADQEQLERLKRSVREWNQWRQEHPKIQPDLDRANLSDADLRQANLRSTGLNSADLGGADLNRADLSNADLREAHLRFANLTSTDLNGADLSNADLHSANLTGVSFFVDAPLGQMFSLSRTNLTKTNLSGANLTKAHIALADVIASRLSGADVTAARFSGVTFAQIDLSLVKGLETTIYVGPSIVDINSVILPHNEPTRLHFLRGVGWTSTQIERLKPQPIQYFSVFISYTDQDQILAKRIYTDLYKKGVRCWFAPHDLRPGTPWARGIEEAIHLYDKLLLILSKNALMSNWVRQEMETAFYKEGTTGEVILFPIRLDNTVLESETLWAKRLRQRQIGDFTDWQDETAYQEALSTLLRHLKVSEPATQ